MAFQSALVTGGAGFIGSHLVEALVTGGCRVTVLDDISSGRVANLEPVLDRIAFVRGSICDRETVEKAAAGCEVVFHLAAVVSVPKTVEDPSGPRPLMAERKICLIDNADRMTIGAANALLKTLEEPPDHSLFLVISSRPAALPSTIRSRCQSLRFTAPARTQVEAALILKREISPDDARFLAIIIEGRLGEALTIDVKDTRSRQQELINLVRPQSLQSIESILSSAEAIAKATRAQDILAWLARWIRDLILIQVGGDRDQLLYLDDLRTLESYAQDANTDQLLDLLREIETTEQRATRNLNLHMALETILLRLREALALTPTRESTA